MARLNPRLRRTFIAVHRFFGQLAALLVLWLATSGLLLNHLDDFVWTKGFVRSDALLDWYGIAPKGEIAHFACGAHDGASLDHGIYLDGRFLAAAQSPLVGAVAFRQWVVLGSADQLLVVAPGPAPRGEAPDARPRIVDRLDSASLPGPLERIGVDATGALVVAAGGRVYAADADLLAWSEAPPSGALAWSAASPPSAQQRKAILRAYRGSGLPRARLIADLHSGRILGRYGPALMDAAAVVLLLLVATGIAGSGLGRRRRTSD